MTTLIHFGLGGHTEYSTDSRLSGYDRPETWRPSPDRDYTGCLVLNVRDAVQTPAGRAWVFAGPMYDPKLSDGAREACPEPSSSLAAGLQGGFKQLLALRPLGGLDSVARTEYVAGWKRHGARVGKVTPDGIEWEPLPPPPPVYTQQRLV